MFFWLFRCVYRVFSRAFYVMEEDTKDESVSQLSDEGFYDQGKDYWANVPATVDGMLGGFAVVSTADISASKQFLRPFMSAYKKPPLRTGFQHALDCGAGIGRITKHFLSDLFQKVDLLEQNKAFLDEARNYLGEKLGKVDRFICSGLHEFEPEPKKYDVIWVQWVLSHIPEEGVVRFLQNSKSGLKEGGLLVIKENVTGSKEVERDEHDFTITRPAQRIRELVRNAGYVIAKEQKQNKFPTGLYEVRMFACRLPSNLEMK